MPSFLDQVVSFFHTLASLIYTTLQSVLHNTWSFLFPQGYEASSWQRRSLVFGAGALGFGAAVVAFRRLTGAGDADANSASRLDAASESDVDSLAGASVASGVTVIDAPHVHRTVRTHHLHRGAHHDDDGDGGEEVVEPLEVAGRAESAHEVESAGESMLERRVRARRVQRLQREEAQRRGDEDAVSVPASTPSPSHHDEDEQEEEVQESESPSEPEPSLRWVERELDEVQDEEEFVDDMEQEEEEAEAEAVPKEPTPRRPLVVVNRALASLQQVSRRTRLMVEVVLAVVCIASIMLVFLDHRVAVVLLPALWYLFRSVVIPGSENDASSATSAPPPTLFGKDPFAQRRGRGPLELGASETPVVSTVTTVPVLRRRRRRERRRSTRKSPKKSRTRSKRSSPSKSSPASKLKLTRDKSPPKLLLERVRAQASAMPSPLSGKVRKLPPIRLGSTGSRTEEMQTFFPSVPSKKLDPESSRMARRTVHIPHPWEEVVKLFWEWTQHSSVAPNLKRRRQRPLRLGGDNKGSRRAKGASRASNDDDFFSFWDRSTTGTSAASSPATNSAASFRKQQQLDGNANIAFHLLDEWKSEHTDCVYVHREVRVATSLPLLIRKLLGSVSHVIVDEYLCEDVARRKLRVKSVSRSFSDYIITVDSRVFSADPSNPKHTILTTSGIVSATDACGVLRSTARKFAARQLLSESQDNLARFIEFVNAELSP